MPFIKISGLTTATAVSATNQFEINQNGGSRSATVAQVAAFARTSATDPVVLPAGTVSAPALTFTGDTNTGIYSPAADTIAFTEGGVEAMRLDASGNVGIGTSSPTSRLTVAGGASPVEIYQNSASVRFSSSPNRTNNYYLGANISDSVDAGFIIGYGTDIGTGTPRIIINSSGNVGVGGSPGTDSRLRIEGTESRLRSVNTTSGAIAYFGAMSPNEARAWSVTGTDLTLGTNNTERMRIDASGRVGIGTSSPASPLEVSSTSQFSGIALTGTGRAWSVGSNSTAVVNVNYQHDAMAFTASGTERMRIDASGNVGIGTSSPVSYAGANDRVLTVFNVDQNITLGARYQIGVGQLAFINSGNTNNTGPTNFALMTGGVERMFITAAGLVGIGTSSPGANLDVAASGTVSAGNVVRVFNSTDGAGAGALGIVKFGSTAAPYGAYAANNVGVNSAFTNLLFGTETAHNAIFYTSNVERMRITAAGNVGIGTSSPQGRFNVSGGRAFFGPNGETYAIGLGFNQTRVNSGQTYYIGATDSATPSLVFSDAGGSERMRIGANGRVGFGTSSTDYPVDIQADAAAFGWNIRGRVADGISVGRFANNSNTETVRLIAYNDSTFAISNTSSTTERMRIDASGNVGINTLSPGARLDVAGFTRLGRYGGAFQGVTLVNDDNSASSETISFIDTQNNLLVADTNIFFGHQTDGGSYISFATTPPGSRSSDRRQERMRLMANGQFYIGTTTPRIAARISVENNGFAGYFACTGTGGGNIPLIVERYSDDGVSIEFKRNNAVVGNINVTSTSTNYSSGSDYRLKENVVPLVGASARVQALKPSRFNFIADPSRTVDGFLAHEAAEVVPEAVSGEKDAVNEDGSIKPQGIDQSKLVPLLTAALQEALAEITSLKARVAILENK